eukprot:3601259-Rhodomonas_salina.2
MLGQRSSHCAPHPLMRAARPLMPHMNLSAAAIKWSAAPMNLSSAAIDASIAPNDASSAAINGSAASRNGGRPAARAVLLP